MLYLVKIITTSLIIVAVSEIAKHSDRLGALLASLPLVTLLVMSWMHFENQDAEKIANHAYYTFWYVIPTLPMFILMPYLLRNGWSFYSVLSIGSLLTVAAFALTAVAVKRIGVDLW